MGELNFSSVFIDRVIRGVMLDKSSKSIIWGINQITEPSLEGTCESREIIDFMDTPIASLDRAKSMSFSGTNAVFDLGLLAAQWGTERNYSSANNTFVAPSFEEFDVKYGDEGTVTLKHNPVGTGANAIPYIYLLDGAGNTSTKYAYGAAASENAFTFNGKTLTYPTGIVSESKQDAAFLVIYNYTANGEDQAIEVINSSDKFPTAGSFVMEILFRDNCDQATCYYGYLELPNAKLDGNITVNITADGKHPFTIKALQEYCSRDRRLCRIVIPEAVQDA